MENVQEELNLGEPENENINESDESTYEDGGTDEEVTNEAETDETEEEESVQLVDVEINGKIFQVPEDVKKSVMLNAEYTEKTTIAAQEREQIATRREILQKDQEFNNEHIGAISQLQALDSQLKEFEQVDWTSYQQQDPDAAQSLFMRYQQLRDQHTRTEREVGDLRTKFSQRKEQELASLTSEAEKVLTRDIKDWSSAKATELNEFAISNFGFTAADLQLAKVDPRIMKLINAAQIGHKASKLKPGVPKIPSKVSKLPTSIKGKGKSSVKQSDDMGIDDWMALENKKQRRG